MEPHLFEVSASWEGDNNSTGSLQSPGGLYCHFAVPTEFGGPGGCPSPEEMLLASLASCYVITIAYMAELKKLPLQKQAITVRGIVERDSQTRRLRFTRMQIALTFFVAPDASDAQTSAIQKLATDAKGYCLISNSLSNEIAFDTETQIVKG